MTTPRRFAPHAPVRVTLRGHTTVRRADGAGRLRVPVRLGPGNPVQALTPGATTRVFQAAVRLRTA